MVQEQASHTTTKLKRLLFGAMLLCGLALPLYLSLAYHALIFRGQLHFVAKDHLAWSSTYLHLDRNPKLWGVILQSSSLRTFLGSHYRDYLQEKLGKQSGSLLDAFHKHSRQLREHLLKQAKEKLIREGKQRLEREKKRFKQTLDKAQERK